MITNRISELSLSTVELMIWVKVVMQTPRRLEMQVAVQLAVSYVSQYLNETDKTGVIGIAE
jgi:hypothetical protein